MLDPTPLPVVFALRDETGAFWPNTAVALSSAAAYASRPLSFHVLHDETLTDLARRRLEQIAAESQATITLTPVQLPKGLDPARLKQFSAASVFRLMIPRLFADLDIVLYLDSDVVVNGVDLAELAAAAPPAAAIAGVVEPHALKYARRDLRDLQLDPRRYINSGVLALRPSRIADDLLGEFVTFSDRHPDLSHPDQSFLNWRFGREVHLLDERFNFQVGVHDGAMFRPLGEYWNKVLHYVGRVKPTNGFLAPGLLPFFLHAHRVPEISRGILCAPTHYLFPLAGDRPGLKVVNASTRQPA